MMTISKIKYAILCVGVLMTAMPQIASAQSSAPLSGLYACEALGDKNAQLTCFVNETAKLRAAETSGDVIAVDKESLNEIKKAEVKKAEIKRVEAVKEKTAKKRTLAIRSTSPSGANGYIRFTLENGEVWQQTEPAYVKLGKASPDMLTIKKASFGSFRATLNDRRPSFSVRQVK